MALEPSTETLEKIAIWWTKTFPNQKIEKGLAMAVAMLLEENIQETTNNVTKNTNWKEATVRKDALELAVRSFEAVKKDHGGLELLTHANYLYDYIVNGIEKEKSGDENVIKLPVTKTIQAKDFKPTMEPWGKSDG